MQVFRTAIEGGLDVSSSILTMADRKPGAAISLLNYEASLQGGYRKINGFSHNFGVVPGTGPVLGLTVRDGVGNGIFACRKPIAGNNYLHEWDFVTSNWQVVTTAGSPTMVGVDRVRILPFNVLTATKIVLTDGINKAATYDGTTYTQITDSNAPTKPKLAAWFASHMVLAGDSTAPNTIYISAPDGETDYSPANGAAAMTLPFKVIALKAFRESLFIFGTNAISKLTGYSFETFKIEEVTNNLGCLAEDSIVELGGDIIFLGPDGIRPISGTEKIGDVELETVSRPIQSIASTLIDNTNLQGLRSVLLRGKSQFRYFFTDQVQSKVRTAIASGTAMTGAGTIILDKTVDFPATGNILINGEEFSYATKADDGYTLEGVTRAINSTTAATHAVDDIVFSTDTQLTDPTGIIGCLKQKNFEFSRLAGLQAHCADSGYIGNTEYILHGTHDGKIFEQEKGNLFGTENISSVFQTPYYDFGDPELDKTVFKITTYIKAEGQCSLNMSLIYDYDNIETLNSENYSVATITGGTVFADLADLDTTFTYDSTNSIYETSNPAVEQSVSGSGKSVSIRYASNDANASHSLQGFAMLYNMEAR